jgi:F0F1-type ATP synthase assembly protein I
MQMQSKNKIKIDKNYYIKPFKVLSAWVSAIFIVAFISILVIKTLRDFKVELIISGIAGSIMIIFSIYNLKKSLDDFSEQFTIALGFACWAVASVFCDYYSI